jgi:hypothetical protein
MTRLNRLLLISSVISALVLLSAAGARADDDKTKATPSKSATTPSHATPAPTGSAAPAKPPGTTSAKPDPSKAQASGAPATGAGAIPGQVGNVLNTLNGFMSGFGH